MIVVSDRNMSDTNSNHCPAINGAVGFPLCSNGARLATRSPVQVFRSFAADLRRPLRTVVARFNGGTRGTSDRNGLSPSVPAPPPEPMPPSRDLSIVDSKELIREVLRRV